MLEEQERLISGSEKKNEDAFDKAIRPRYMSDYIGQPKVCEQMDIFIPAAKQRHEALDHVLIFGPPGLGKTTLSHIIANEMGVSLRQTSGPVLERPGDLAALLTNLEENDILFIDEILSRISTIKRSAVFLPIPGSRTSRVTSSFCTAWTNSTLLIPERIVKASFGPTPLILINCLKNTRS